MTRLRSRIYTLLLLSLSLHSVAVSIGTPVREQLLQPSADPFGTYSGVGGFTLTGIVSATEIRGDGRFLTGVSAGKFVTETAVTSSQILL